MCEQTSENLKENRIKYLINRVKQSLMSIRTSIDEIDQLTSKKENDSDTESDIVKVDIEDFTEMFNEISDTSISESVQKNNYSTIFNNNPSDVIQFKFYIETDEDHILQYKNYGKKLRFVLYIPFIPENYNDIEEIIKDGTYCDCNKLYIIKMYNEEDHKYTLEELDSLKVSITNIYKTTLNCDEAILRCIEHRRKKKLPTPKPPLNASSLKIISGSPPSNTPSIKFISGIGNAAHVPW